MINLVDSWKESLIVFHPKKLWELVFKAFVVGANGLVHFFKKFGLIFFADVIFFALFRKSLLVLFEMIKTHPSDITLSLIIIRVVYGVFWLIINSCLLLSIRKSFVSTEIGYFAQGFLHLILLSLFGSFLFSLGFVIVLNFGITVFPKFPAILFVIWNVLSLLTIFFWIDFKFSFKVVLLRKNESSLASYFKNMFYYFKDVFISLERAINMVLYNVPFFIVAIIIGYFLNKAFNYFLIGSYKLLIFEEGQFIFNDIIFKAKNAQSISFMVHAIAKYGKLVIS